MAHKNLTSLTRPCVHWDTETSRRPKTSNKAVKLTNIIHFFQTRKMCKKMMNIINNNTRLFAQLYS